MADWSGGIPAVLHHSNGRPQQCTYTVTMYLLFTTICVTKL